MKSKSILTAALFLVGCAMTPPPPPPLTDADYGSFPQEYESIIKTCFEQGLKDPFSAHYKFTEPRKGITRDPPILGSGFKAAGWFVDVEYNAKNGMGGYNGWKPAQFFIKDGKIVGIFGTSLSCQT